MRILIDTHILIWHLDGDSRLSKKTIEIIENENNEIVISVASLWELAIKINSDKFEINITLKDIQQYILNRNVEILNIQFNALLVFSELVAHHNDPFDRMLISQSISENIPIISVDRHFPLYPIVLIS